MTDPFIDILRANAEYARCIDEDRLEQWPDFFVDDCLYRVTSARDFRDGLEAALIFANSKGMLRDRISALRTANIYERQAYRHLIGAPCVLEADAARIRADSPFMVARIMRDGSTLLFASGVYRDVWRREAGGLRLAERVVICDSHRIDTLLVLPL